MVGMDRILNRESYMFWFFSALTGFLVAHLLYIHIYAWFNKSLDASVWGQANLALTELLPFSMVALFSDKKTLITGSKVGFFATVCTEILSKQVQILTAIEARDTFLASDVFSLIVVGIIVKILAKIADLNYQNLWVSITIICFIVKLYLHIITKSVIVGVPGHHINIFIVLVLIIFGLYSEKISEKKKKSHNVVTLY